ncbi:MAG: hypothetical protein WC700_09875 [Gemmatimonadaceae bacterium]
MYREGSRDDHVLSTGTTADAANLNRRMKRSRRGSLRGTTIRKEIPLGVMFVNITEAEKGQPFAVRLVAGQSGCAAGPAEHADDDANRFRAADTATRTRSVKSAGSPRSS